MLDSVLQGHVASRPGHYYGHELAVIGSELIPGSGRERESEREMSWETRAVYFTSISTSSRSIKPHPLAHRP
jgi:hypothetical protein